MRLVLTGFALAAVFGVAVSCTLDVGGTGDEVTPGGGGVGGVGGSGVECTQDDQCPADTPCATHSCSPNGTCQVSLVPAGTPVAGSVVGDCRAFVCNGAGTSTEQADDSDLPDDGDDCTDDLCVNGAPQHPLKPADSPCGVTGAGLYCNAAGQCVGCEAADECSHNDCQTPTCVSNICGTTLLPAGTEVLDASPADCTHEVCNAMGQTVVEADADDAPTDNNACTTDSCAGTVPTFVDLNNGDMCPTGFCYFGMCSECGIDTNCPVGACQTTTCNGGMCAAPTTLPDGTTCGATAGDACCMGMCQPGGCGTGGGGGAGGGGGSGGAGGGN